MVLSHSTVSWQKKRSQNVRLWNHQDFLKQISVFTICESCASITRIPNVWPTPPPHDWLTYMVEHMSYQLLRCCQPVGQAAWKCVQSMAHSQAHWVSWAGTLACWFANSFMHEVDGLVTNPRGFADWNRVNADTRHGVVGLSSTPGAAGCQLTSRRFNPHLDKKQIPSCLYSKHNKKERKFVGDSSSGSSSSPTLTSVLSMLFVEFLHVRTFIMLIFWDQSNPQMIMCFWKEN